jgi:hypothetical protein
MSIICSEAIEEKVLSGVSTIDEILRVVYVAD